MPVFSDKKEARVHFAGRRAAIAADPKEKKRLDSLIVRWIISDSVYEQADTVLAYYPVRDEIDLRPLIERALLDGKRVALPVTRDGDMEFCLYTGDLTVGDYGIPHPTGDRVDADAHTLCIVPGYACDEERYRLGYGGGYYDRFLSYFTGVSLGAFYSGCTHAVFPKEEHDRPFRLLVTEEGIF